MTAVETDRPEQKISVISGVREYSEGWDVELWRSKKGRLIVRAYNEAHNNYTNVDLLDLIEGLSLCDPDGLSLGVVS